MPEPRRIDIHVHMVGNGLAGSGGWLRLNGWHRWLAGFMIKQLGFPAAVLTQDLESIYAAHLLDLIRSSSLDAAVLLAHERVYDPDGTVREDLGSMYLPNDVVLDLAARHPEFLAGVSIHPARSDAVGELERCLERGFDEMSAELPKHRLFRPALSPFLEANGRSRPSASRPHGRRKHSSGSRSEE